MSGKVCLRCFSILREDDEKCTNCGHIEGMKNEEGTLPLKAILQDKYLIGMVSKRNAETIEYIAFDKVLKDRVTIIEYYPTELCDRAKDGALVEVKEGSNIFFKTLKSDFADLYKKLRTLDINSTPEIYSVFEENETVYVVTEYIETTTLAKFLIGKDLSSSVEGIWKFMKPLLEDINILHQDNIIHRGISPQNISLARDGKLILTGFATSALRSEGEDLTPERYEGFTAPEQYKKDGWQGTFSDIYAICKIFELLCKNISEDRISPEILEVFEIGTNQATKNRQQDAKELIMDIEEALSPKEVKPTKIAVKQGGKGQAVKTNVNKSVKPRPKKKKYRVPLVLIVFIAVLLTVGIFLWVIDWLDNAIDLSGDESSSSSSSVVEEVLTTPNFEGKRYTVIASDPENHIFNIIRDEDYNRNVPEGSIISQTPLPDTEIEEGDDITVVVSLGVELVAMPNVIGLSRGDVESVLKNAGLDRYEFYTIYDPSVLPGLAVRTSVPVGEEVNPLTENIEVFLSTS